MHSSFRCPTPASSRLSSARRRPIRNNLPLFSDFTKAFGLLKQLRRVGALKRASASRTGESGVGDQR
ncbi:MAG TPA: hypothetical protein DFL85_10540 [Lentisphaeria bacterium]|nr:hypothetical protein C5Q97_10430 [Victivallales bacterium CCUG 44730]HCH85940.1 hypothetical protein [Lentisphaeria bacterium]